MFRDLCVYLKSATVGKENIFFFIGAYCVAKSLRTCICS